MNKKPRTRLKSPTKPRPQWYSFGKKIFIAHWSFFLGLFFFGLLLFHNPYGMENHIGNLEPFPDTISYITSALSFIHGHGFVLYRLGHRLKSAVPPLYSLALVPLFLLNSDPRTFYFTNIALAFLSACLFYKIIQKIVMNLHIRTIIFFTYLSSFLIYFYPTYALAENLVIPLFLLAIYVLLQKISGKMVIFAALLPILLFAAKYVNLPLSFIFFCLYAAKIWQENKKKKVRKKLLKELGLYGLGFYIAYIFLFQLFTGEGLSLQSFFLVNKFTEILFFAAAKSTTSAGEHIPFFSLHYLFPHLFEYIVTFLQGNGIVAETKLPFVAQFVVPFGVPAYFINCWNKKNQFFHLSLAIIFTSMLIFISTFYVVDFRYIFFLLPTTLITFGILLEKSPDYIQKLELPKKTFSVLLLSVYGAYLFFLAPSVFAQIHFNFAERTPLYDNYYVVLQLNNYFSQKTTDENTQPVVLSVLPPYYVDYFSNGHYRIMPASSLLYVSGTPTQLYGDEDFSNTMALYKKFLENGREVYISTYIDMTRQQYIDDQKMIGTLFVLNEVKEDCNGACNLYQLHLATDSAALSSPSANIKK